MNLNPSTINVKIKVVEEKKLKAIISISFGDFVIKGFRIMESEYANANGDKLWVTPPCYNDSGGRFHPIFYMPNKELWQELEKIIWNEYYKQMGEYYKKRFDLTDDNPITDL